MDPSTHNVSGGANAFKAFLTLRRPGGQVEWKGTAFSSDLILSQPVVRGEGVFIGIVVPSVLAPSLNIASRRLSQHSR
jgi:hypothetical protein